MVPGTDVVPTHGCEQTPVLSFLSLWLLLGLIGTFCGLL